MYIVFMVMIKMCDDVCFFIDKCHFECRTMTMKSRLVLHLKSGKSKQTDPGSWNILDLDLGFLTPRRIETISEVVVPLW